MSIEPATDEEIAMWEADMSDITITTRKQVIAAAPDRWARQYADYRFTDADRKAEITKQLQALSAEEVTKENVDRITGNQSWTRLECDSCQEDSEAVANFDYWSEHSVSVCLKCLNKAKRLLKAPSKQDGERS